MRVAGCVARDPRASGMLLTRNGGATCPGDIKTVEFALEGVGRESTFFPFLFVRKSSSELGATYLSKWKDIIASGKHVSWTLYFERK